MREQREIKFRAWYPDDDRMEYQDGKTPAWLGDILTNGYYIPMQYTGLQDKAGKEIYEGDIVQWAGYEVSNGKQMRPLRKKAVGMNVDPSRNTFIDDCFHIQNLIEHGDKFISVIGNIYENPGLLAGEKE